jgi:hypothetical protein
MFGQLSSFKFISLDPKNGFCLMAYRHFELINVEDKLINYKEEHFFDDRKFISDFYSNCLH